MGFVDPKEFTPGAQAQNPNYIEYERDDSGPPRNWRIQTPPAGEDGTVPSIADTVTPP